MSSIFGQIETLQFERMAPIYVFGFQNTFTEPDPTGNVKVFRRKVNKTLETIDEKMTMFIAEGHAEDFPTWANIMKVAVEQLNKLDRNLSQENIRTWDKSEVIAAMAILEAIRISVTTILQNNGIELS